MKRTSFFKQAGATCARTLAALATLAITATLAIAKPTQEEALRSISENVGGGSSGGSSSGGGGGVPEIPHLFAFVVLIAGVVMILIWWNARQPKPKKVKQVNHSRKLLKQISREMGLASVEVKQLKILADVHERTTGQPLQSPLTILLCPSILSSALQTGDVKIDRQVVAGLARRILKQQAKA